MRLLVFLLVAAPLVASAQFVENRGQWPEEVRFLAQTPDHAVWITRDGFTADLRSYEAPPVRDVAEAARATVRRRGFVVNVRVAGAMDEAEPRDALPGRRHYVVGEEAVTGVRAYREVRVPTETGAIRYSLSPRGLRATVEGEAALTVEGAPLADVAGGLVRVRADGLRPLAEVVYEGAGSLREAAVQGGLLVPGGPWAEPPAPARDAGDDPVIWSTYLGDTGSDFADEVAVDPQGRVVVAGFTSSVDFPTTPGAYDETYNFQSDAFVARFTADGSALDYATVLGGGSLDIGYGVATNAAGQVVVVGETISPDFPRTAGVQPSDESTAFAARLSPDGSALEYSLLVGGDGPDQPRAVVLDDGGNAIIAGSTFSTNLATTNLAYDRSYNGSGDAFVVGIGDGEIAFSTYLGGFDNDTADALAFTTDRRVVVAGGTLSIDFPTTPGAFSTTHAGIRDAFVAWLSTDGTTLDQSTFLGGFAQEVVWAVDADEEGRVVIGGETRSTNLPTTDGSVSTAYEGGQADGFVAQLSPDASSLDYGAFLGGNDLDVVHGVAFDPDGRIVATGATRSADFPAPMGAFAAFDDAFAVRVAPEGFYFDGGTFLSGADVDEARDLAVAPDGRLLVAGATRSTDYPATPGAFDLTQGGSSDVFVTALSLPVLVSREEAPVVGVEISAPAPNPASTSARLALSLEAPALVRVDVLDALGRLVVSLPERALAAGPHEVEFPLRGLAPGVYAVRASLNTASGEEAAVSRRLVVAR